MKFFRDLLGGRDQAAPAGGAVAAAPEQVAAAVDFQKTMGRDRVTGLPHRACFTHVLGLQAQISAQLETRLSVIVLEWPDYATDPDLIARDRTLNRIATTLRHTLHRAHDVLGSLGDGRLAAMLPFTDGAGADTVARKLQRAARAAVLGEHAPVSAALPAELGAGEAEAEALDIPQSPDADDGPFINVGIAAYNGKGVLEQGALLAAAERAIEYAALNGGERIVRFDPGAEVMRL